MMADCILFNMDEFGLTETLNNGRDSITISVFVLDCTCELVMVMLFKEMGERQNMNF